MWDSAIVGEGFPGFLKGAAPEFQVSNGAQRSVSVGPTVPKTVTKVTDL